MKLILIVEDDANLRAVLQHKLEQEGFGVEVAADGFEALAQVKNHSPDLILLDLIMPSMDGWEMLLRLRGELQMCDIPVIVMSVLESGPARRLTEMCGAVDFVQKPFSLRKMVDRIRALLDGEYHGSQAGRGIKAGVSYFQPSAEAL